MRYNIVIEKKARKFIDTQPKLQQERILKAIYKLPHAGDIKPLMGYSDAFRLRVGGYRVIFTRQDDMLRIRVVNVGNRGQIYK